MGSRSFWLSIFPERVLISPLPSLCFSSYPASLLGGGDMTEDCVILVIKAGAACILCPRSSYLTQLRKHVVLVLSMRCTSTCENVVSYKSLTAVGLGCVTCWSSLPFFHGSSQFKDVTVGCFPQTNYNFRPTHTLTSSLDCRSIQPKVPDPKTAVWGGERREKNTSQIRM